MELDHLDTLSKSTIKFKVVKRKDSMITFILTIVFTYYFQITYFKTCIIPNETKSYTRSQDTHEKYS